MRGGQGVLRRRWRAGGTRVRRVPLFVQGGKRRAAGARAARRASGSQAGLTLDGVPYDVAMPPMPPPPQPVGAPLTATLPGV